MAIQHRNHLTEADLSAALPAVLGAVLQGSGWKAAGLRRERPLKHGLAADAVVRLRSGPARATLVVQFSANPRLGSVREKALLLQYVLPESLGGETTALAFFVPRVTTSLADVLRDLNVGYLDLSGACRLQWPGLAIERPGTPPEPTGAAGSPSSSSLDPAQVFGPRAPRRHRVLRALLSWPGRRWHQVELAEESDTSVFTVHGVIQHLLAEHYADEEGRGPQKVVFLECPGALLDAWVVFWRTSWRRSQQSSALFHGLGGGQGDLRGRIGAAAADVRARVGLTLSAGANCYGPYLRDEVVHAYVLGDLEALARAADLEPVASGANVILYPIAEEGLLYLTDELRDHVGPEQGGPAAPVCPAQLYLDMKAAGGRLAEQADRLREDFIGHDS